jgi:hypothetical protein
MQLKYAFHGETADDLEHKYRRYHPGSFSRSRTLIRSLYGGTTYTIAD